MTKLKNLKKGFTLVELLIVMALIGVLATALFTLVNPLAQFGRARDTQRKNDLAQIGRALEQYYNDFGRYPNSSGSPNYYILGSSTAWGLPWTPYMDIVQKDPVSAQRYRYIVPSGSNNQSYTLYAHLENNSDTQLCTPGSPTTPCSGVGSVNCGTGFICNYGVSSPNISP